jgi:non-specific serine/threonine protein kinase
MPVETSFYEPYFQAAFAQLGKAAWETAWSEGKAMAMEEAMEYALSEEDLSIPLAPEQRAGKESTPLTRREQEVARLVARGLTNRQVAAQLSISEHTVATHIAKILKKLGLNSRSQFGAWLIEHRSSGPDQG